VTEVQRSVTSERYEQQVGRTATAIVDRVEPDGRVQGRTYAQADDIDGVTWVRWENGDGRYPMHPGDIIEVTLDAVVTDHDFEATLVRHVSTATSHKPSLKPRALPVMSTAGAFGR
jgi:hypothetical protein